MMKIPEYLLEKFLSKFNLRSILTADVNRSGSKRQTLVLLLSLILIFSACLKRRKINRAANTKENQIALISASTKGQVDIVKALLDKGVDADAKDQIGHTALMIAAQNGHIKVVKMLLSYDADVNMKGVMSGMTALMWAVMKGHKNIVKVLLAEDANVKIKNRQGISAIIIARRRKNSSIIQLLQQAGAKE